MEISPSNSIAFSGLLSACRKRMETRHLRRRVKRAEKLLNERLIEHDTLMLSPESGLICNCSTGENFSGKFAVSGGKMERLYRIKDGQIVVSLVRFKNGLRYWAKRGDKSKNFFSNVPIISPKIDIMEMRFADKQVFENMLKRFAQLIEQPAIIAVN